jgi:hypothetical protein
VTTRRGEWQPRESIRPASASSVEREEARLLNDLSISTNEVIKKLIVVATIVLPLTFVVGVYGMNFGASPYDMPELGWTVGYPAVVVGMGLVAVVLLAYVRREDWLETTPRDRLRPERRAVARQHARPKPGMARWPEPSGVPSPARRPTPDPGVSFPAGCRRVPRRWSSGPPRRHTARAPPGVAQSTRLQSVTRPNAVREPTRSTPASRRVRGPSYGSSTRTSSYSTSSNHSTRTSTN